MIIDQRTHSRGWLQSRNTLKQHNSLTNPNHRTPKNRRSSRIEMSSQKDRWKHNYGFPSGKWKHKANAFYSHSFCTLDGTILHYQVVGQGAPLVLLHGNSQQHLIFHHQVDYFKKHYKVILIDAKRPGISSLGPFNLAAKSLAEDTIHVLDHLHIRNAYVLGYGDGANTALELAMKAPLLIKAMMITSANIVTKELNAAAHSLYQVKHKVISFLQQFGILNQERHSFAKSKADYPQMSDSELAKITIPTLIISGGKDTFRTPYANRLARHIPNAELVSIPGAGHLGILTHAKEYNFILRNFLNQTEL